MACPASLMSPQGVGGGCVTLPRGGRSSVPRGGPQPATRSIRRPVGTLTQHVADGIIRCIAQTSAVHTQLDGRGMLMFHSHDKRSFLG